MLRRQNKGNILLAQCSKCTFQLRPVERSYKPLPNPITLPSQFTLLLTPPLLQLLQNPPLQRLRLRRTRPPPLHLSISPHQKLFEIPFHTLHTKQAGCGCFQIFEEWGGGRAVDVKFGEDGEGDAVVELAKGLDGIVVALGLVSVLCGCCVGRGIGGGRCGRGVWFVFWGVRDGGKGTNGILVHELVAGETEDDEVIGVLFFNLLVKLFEAFKLRREAAFGGGVYDEDDFVFEGGERVGLAFLCW